MKHKMKKVLSVLLAGLLSLSMLGISAFAEGEAAKDFVGYHRSRVQKVDLTNIPNIKTYDLNDPNYEEKLAYKVTDVDGMIHFSNVVVKDHLEDVTVYLAKDLDMTGVTDWLPIGSTTDLYFGGTFDGQGHVIDNLIVNDVREGHNSDGFVWTGVFGYVLAGTIKNVVIGANCSFTYAGTAKTPHVAALVAGIGNDPTLGASTIENCYAQGTVVGARFTGGIVARVQGGTNATSRHVINNCTNAADLSGTGAIAGFGAFVQKPLDITNCRNTGDITNTHKSNDFNAASSAFVGRDHWNDGGVHISNCINNGNITGRNYIAIFVGYLDHNTTNQTTVNDCVNYGTYTVTEEGTQHCDLICSGYGHGAANCDPIANANVEDKQGQTDPTLEDMETIVPDFTPALDLNKDGTDMPVLRAVQNTSVLNGKQGVRFLAVVNSLDYESIGFEWNIKYTKAGETEATLDANGTETATTVYRSITAEDMSGNIYAVSATDLNGTYIYALSFKNVPTDGTVVFTVTPIAASDNAPALTGTGYTVTFENGAFVSSEAVSTN